MNAATATATALFVGHKFDIANRLHDLAGGVGLRIHNSVGGGGSAQLYQGSHHALGPSGLGPVPKILKVDRRHWFGLFVNGAESLQKID